MALEGMKAFEANLFHFFGLLRVSDQGISGLFIVGYVAPTQQFHSDQFLLFLRKRLIAHEELVEGEANVVAKTRRIGRWVEVFGVFQMHDRWEKCIYEGHGLDCTRTLGAFVSWSQVVDENLPRHNYQLANLD